MGTSTVKPCRRLLIRCFRAAGFLQKFPHRRPPDPGDLLLLRRSSSAVFCLGPPPIPTRGFSMIPAAVSATRRFSTSAEPIPGDKAFERMYIHGMDSMMPLSIERTPEESKGFGGGNFLNSEAAVEEEREGLGGGNLVNSAAVEVGREAAKEREVSEVEKEAWSLINRAVVNYCTNPVGTVAANDPAENQALNYDQVFIRDFVPAALAFLLKGESEIVRNFLLHTLQLQLGLPCVD